MAKQDLHKYVLDMVYKYRWIDQALDDLEQEVGYVDTPHKAGIYHL